MTDNIRDYVAVLAEMQEKSLAKRGSAIVSPASFMLQHGQSFRVGPETYSGKRGEPKMCYRNAGRIATRPYCELIYCEGYTTSVGIPIPHAWLATRDGYAIDPTLRGPDDVSKLPRQYFGLPFKRDHVILSTTRSGYWSLLDSPSSPTLRAIMEGRGLSLLARIG